MRGGYGCGSLSSLLGGSQLFKADKLVGQLGIGLCIERAVETGDDEHEHLGAHADEQHDVGALDVCELEQGAENHNGCTP